MAMRCQIKSILFWQFPVGNALRLAWVMFYLRVKFSYQINVCTLLNTSHLCFLDGVFFKETKHLTWHWLFCFHFMHFSSKTSLKISSKMKHIANFKRLTFSSNQSFLTWEFLEILFVTNCRVKIFCNEKCLQIFIMRFYITDDFVKKPNNQR